MLLNFIDAILVEIQLFVHLRRDKNTDHFPNGKSANRRKIVTNETNLSIVVDAGVLAASTHRTLKFTKHIYNSKD